MHASIHEDNARTLQGILDTLREILGAREQESVVAAARRLAGESVKPESEHPGHVSAQSYLRSRYGAYRGHFAWRELEEAFNAGMSSHTGVVPVGDFEIESTRSEAAKPHPDGWLQSGGLLYRLTDDRHPQNRDEINVTMADGSRSDESRARRAGELLDRIRATHPAPVPVAPAATSKPGQISASVLKDSIRKFDPNGVVLVEEVWHLLDATPAGQIPISLNALKTRVRNRASAGAILVKDLTAIVETMAHAATNGAADGYQ